MHRFFMLFMLLFFFSTIPPACSSTGIAIRERLGIPKRSQLVDRVDDARQSQEAAKEQFASTLDELNSISGYKDDQLESSYARLNALYERSESRAERVRSKIKAVDRVATALFREWDRELGEYASDSLRADSAKQLDETKERFGDVLIAMRRAQAKMDPVLAAFHDQVLFLKHNLNARAVAALDSTLEELRFEIAALIEDMNSSIEEANSFIDDMSKSE